MFAEEKGPTWLQLGEQWGDCWEVSLEKQAGSFQDMVSSLDFNLNAMGSHRKILSKKVTQIDLYFHKMFQNSGPRWCRPEGWLREPNVPLYPASLFTCPDLGPENKCPDTGPSLSKQSPGLQVLQLEHSLGHQPPHSGVHFLCIFSPSRKTHSPCSLP